MTTVTGLTAARMLEIEAASIVAARLEGDNLILTTKGGTDLTPMNVRGATGATGATGPVNGILGLVAMDEYSATDPTKSGADDTYHDVDGISLSYDFVLGRSYRIDCGITIEFQTLGVIDQIITLELREGSNALRRFTIPGDEDGHTSGVGGSHLIKSCPWSGTKTLNLRFVKRSGSDVVIKNSFAPSFVSITDLGDTFA